MGQLDALAPSILLSTEVRRQDSPLGQRSGMTPEPPLGSG